MRNAFLLLAAVVAGCASDVVDVVAHAPVPNALVLQPKSKVLDTAATFQFEAKASWSDGTDRPVSVVYATTGGEITTAGLYRASSTPGSFLVVATCVCGFADTATVTVASVAPPAPGLGALVVAVTGLPTGAFAAVTVSGPGGFARGVSTPGPLDSLPPGAYEIRASGVTIGNNNYEPVNASQMITVQPGAVGSVEIAYRLISNGGLLAHPRVWMTPQRVTRLRAQASANTVRWTRVKGAADGQLGRGAAVQIEDLDKVPDLCLAYLGSSDARYASRAGAILEWYAVEANNLTGDSGYGYRFNLPLVTMGLDWCYDGLTVAQRQQTATWLMNRADWVWPQTNPARSSGFAVNDASNNYWWGFMMSGPAALAAQGDDTGSSALSGTDRAAFHRQLALTKWNTQAQSYFNGEGVGGAWAEGTNYESTWRVGSFVDAYQTAGTPLTAPWLQDAMRWKLHSTMPRGQFKAALGDQPRVSDASFFTYDRMHALYALEASGADAVLTGQMYAWLNLIGQVASSEFNATATLADELLRFDPAQPVGDLSALPKGYHAAGAGYFIYRQSWTDPNATAMVFESGPVNSGGHGARDANGLMIWKGSSWISTTANIYSHSGIETATKNYNNLTVGGLGQVLYGANYGNILGTPQMSDQLVAVRGQAKFTYGYPTGVSYGRTVVSDYQRTVAYLPQQDVFVIVDQATVFNAALPKVWRWQMKDVPEVNGNTFRLQSQAGDFRCFGAVLAPTDVVLGTEAYALGNGLGVSSNAVTVTMAGRASDVVVTVLQCTGAQAAPYTPSATVNQTEAAVTVAGRRVVVPFSETAPVRIE